MILLAGFSGFFGLIPLALDPGRQITQYGLRSWGPDEGLPTGAVRALAQGSDGWLWIGTHEGLCRFDGIRFSRPAEIGGRELTLRGVSALLPGEADELWIGTGQGGLSRWRAGFQPALHNFSHLPAGSRRSIISPVGRLEAGAP
jgi:ligand-binding sensor domain-containing protein